MASSRVDLGTSAFCLKFSGSGDCSNNTNNTNIGRSIYYIGAVHGNDSRTLELISGLPHCDAIVVEGYSGEISCANECDNGESAHAIRVARAKNVAVYGAETPVNVFCAEVWRLGKYSLADIKGWVFLVIARQCYDQDKTFAEMMDDYEKYSEWYVELILEAQCGESGRYDPLEWFHNTFGKQYEYGKFLDHASPRANANNVSRRIANSIAARRNPALMKNLCDISARHRVVAYVIGRDHIRYDLPVLMEMFSECTIVG